MNNKNLLTYNAKVNSVGQVYYSPVAVLPPPLSTVIGTTYCFLAHIDPWEDDNDPPQPQQDQSYLKSVFKSIFVAKKVTINDLSPVIERINWESGITYDYYQDSVDMFAVDLEGKLVKRFYVKNKFDQVFKCLWNNNGSPSTFEPFFQPGNYGTNNIYTGVDGYKWKYMYTIDIGLKQKFMDMKWIPIPEGASIPNTLSTTAGSGDIEVINVTDSGSGYDPANSLITISITGDGTGAAAVAEVIDGSIAEIVVTNAGSNYTFANVSIISSVGTGAIATAPISPIGGHAFDPISELGCSHIMFTSEFNGSEGGLIPVDIDYRQVGLLINPIALSTAPKPADAPIYKTTTDFIVAPGFGQYVVDDTIYQGTSLAEATFSARILSFDVETNVIRLINTVGTPVYNAPVFSTLTGTVRTLLSVSLPDLQPFSGYMIYIENRTGIQRSSDGIEQFRFVLGY